MNAPVRFSAVSERYRLRVDDFVVLADGGTLDAYRKSELIDGDIYVMNAQWSRHARIKDRLARKLGNQLEATGSELEPLTEVSVRASDHDMPEPDIVLTRWKGDRDVPIETVALVVEVSDTTLASDAGAKLTLYASAGVPEYWIVDVTGGRVLLHAVPQGETYATQSEVAFGAELASLTLRGLRVDTAIFLS